MKNGLAEVVDKTVIMEVDAELSLCSCESDVVDETCSLGGDDTRHIRKPIVNRCTIPKKELNEFYL